MPELPEVETTRRLIEPLVVGRTITSVNVDHPRMLRRQEQPADFAARLAGRTIVATGRLGKHLFLHLDGDITWVVHLGMSGRMSVARAGEERPLHTHVVVVLDDGDEVRFTDPRTFGWTVALTPEEMDEAPFARLGPDALESLPAPAELLAALRGRRASIKALLLDQRIVAGMGNIYADEALHRARLSPHRPGGSLDEAEARRLLDSMRATVEDGIRAGGTTLSDLAYLLPDGRSGEFTADLAAYGREGEPCLRCGRPIERDVIRARSTFWCPGCQK